MLLIGTVLISCGESKKVSIEGTATSVDDMSKKIRKSVVMENDDLSVRITHGLRGVLTNDIVFPVQMEITNKGKDFSGTAIVTVPDRQQKKGISYEQDIFVKAGEKQNVSIQVPKNMNFGRLKVSLKQGEKEVLQKNIKVHTLYEDDSEFDKVLIGILSKKPEMLEYFNQLSFNSVYNSAIKTSNYYLETFPEDIETFNMFSFLIIDQFPTTKLSKKQQSILKTWIQNGGVLILSAGGESQEVLNGFDKEYFQYQVGETKKVPFVFKADTSTKSILVESTKFQVEGATLLDSFGKGIEVWNLEKGKGNIVITSCMLGNPSFMEWSGKQDFATTFIKKTMSRSLKEQLKERNAIDNYNYSIEKILSSNHSVKIPKTSFYIILFILYILFIGPISYFFLKKRDKREWIWAVIPMIAFIFYFVVFSMNKGSKIVTPIGNSVTMIDSSSENWKEKIYISLMNPKRKPYTVTLKKLCQSVVPLSTSYNDWIDDNAYNLDVVRYSMKKQEEQTMVTFHDKEAFVSNMFAMEAQEKKQKSGFHKNLTITKEGISGTVTNETGYPISEAGVFYNGMYVYLGDLKVGETVSIDSNTTELVASKYSDIMANMFVDHMDIDTREMRAKRYQFQETYRFLVSYLEDLKTKEGCVFGIVEQYDNDYIEDDFVVESGSAVFYDIFEQKMQDNTEYYVSNILENMVFAKNGEISTYYNELYGESDEVEFEFDNAYNIQRLFCSNLTTEEPYKENGLAIYAWNYEEKAYEQIFENKKELEQADLSQYIVNHRLRLKFVCSSGSSLLPIISVTGGEKVVRN